MIVGPDGQPQHILATGRDVTESQRLEEQLRQAQKMESVGRLAGGIAHDFNNLLTAIRGYAELMLIDFDAGADPGRDCAEQIARAADRAASLTGQLLAFSRKQVLRPQLIDLNEIVEGMATMLDAHARRGRRCSRRRSTRSSARPWPTRPSSSRSFSTSRSTPATRCRRAGTSSCARSGWSSARTTSCPTPTSFPARTSRSPCATPASASTPSLAEQVFEPFFTTKDVGEGTGLGLSTVHGIVSQSGGAIWMDSTLGEGTCFTVCLPVAGDAP